MAADRFKKINGSRELPPHNRKRIISKLSNSRTNRIHGDVDRHVVSFHGFRLAQDVLHCIYHH
jgi:hypothetical protein